MKVANCYKMYAYAYEEVIRRKRIQVADFTRKHTTIGQELSAINEALPPPHEPSPEQEKGKKKKKKDKKKDKEQEATPPYVPPALPLDQVEVSLCCHFSHCTLFSGTTQTLHRSTTAM